MSVPDALSLPNIIKRYPRDKMTDIPGDKMTDSPRDMITKHGLVISMVFITLFSSFACGSLFLAFLLLGFAQADYMLETKAKILEFYLSTCHNMIYYSFQIGHATKVWPSCIYVFKFFHSSLSAPFTLILEAIGVDLLEKKSPIL